jgi:hypothetical protein
MDRTQTVILLWLIIPASVRLTKAKVLIHILVVAPQLMSNTLVNVWLLSTRYILTLIKHRTMKTYEGVEVQLHLFITSALDGSEWSDLRYG